jgi:hypothetical protein
MPTTQAQEGSDATLLQGAPALAVVVATDALLEADIVEVDRTKHWPDEAARGPCFDSVIRSSGPSTPGCTTSGDAVPAPGFSSVVDPGVAGLGLSGSFGLPSPPID